MVDSFMDGVFRVCQENISLSIAKIKMNIMPVRNPVMIINIFARMNYMDCAILLSRVNVEADVLW